jgi:preprotein translocase subunit SecF
MEFFRRETHIDFFGKRRIAFALSALMIVAALVAIGVRGLNLGLDFTGGTVIEVGYPQPAELDQVRATLTELGYNGAVVQNFGNARDVLIRIQPDERSSTEVSQRVVTALQADSPNLELRRVEFVGPQVGDQLKEQGGLAVLGALLGILAYVAFRFEFRLAVGAVAALAHDILITVGFFAVTGIPFDLTVLAALLAVLGYSINDTIVVFDRIRENFIRVRKGSPADVANLSINQTLSRTLMTSGTTLLVLVALYVVGGELIAGFSLALIVGIVVGTFSSVYVASALALALGVSKEDLAPPPKEAEELDDRP